MKNIGLDKFTAIGGNIWVDMSDNCHPNIRGTVFVNIKLNIRYNIISNIWGNIMDKIFVNIQSSILLKNKVKQTILNNIIDGKYTMENYGQYL